MVEDRVDEEMEVDLTIDEFIALLRYINKRLEIITREASRFQKLSRKYSHYSGGYEDLFKLILASSTGRAATKEEEEIVEDEEVKLRAKQIAKRLRKHEGKNKSS